MSLGQWFYSPDHGQLCQVVETQMLWGETVCRVWLPGKDTIMRMLIGCANVLKTLRERTLMREFEEYRESKQKRLKVFRLEAVRAGFKKAWQERDYATIIAVAHKIPENVLQEDPKLLMWYDQAVTRMGEE